MPNQGPDRGSAPLPPAVTRWTGTNAGNDRGAPMAPPFRPAWSKQATPPAPSAAKPAAPVAAPPKPAAEEMTLIWEPEVELDPAYEGDISLTPRAKEVEQPRKEFPIDAFIPAAHDVANRFEKLSRRLRAEELDSVMVSLAGGDRFEVMLAAFLTGYLSKHDG